MYPETVRGGRLGGPVAFFDQEYSAVVILSPLNHFMAVNMEVEANVFNFGLMGSIEVWFFFHLILFLRTVIDMYNTQIYL